MSTTHHIFRSLSIVHRHGMIYMKRRFLNDEMRKSHPPFLFMISRNEGISQDELAKKLRFDKGAVARVVKELEGEGYITRERDSKDKRKYNIFPTKKGKTIIPILKEVEQSYENVLTHGMTDEQIQVFQGLIEKAAENILNATKDFPDDNPLQCGGEKGNQFVITTVDTDDNKE